MIAKSPLPADSVTGKHPPRRLTTTKNSSHYLLMTYYVLSLSLIGTFLVLDHILIIHYIFLSVFFTENDFHYPII